MAMTDPSTCALEGCGYVVARKGLCRKHYGGRGRSVRHSSYPRIPVAPLLVLVEARADAFAEVQLDAWGNHGGERLMPLSYKTFRRLKSNPLLSIYEADLLACAMGLHPLEIWPDFDRIEAA